MERIIIGSMLFAALFSVIACSNESTNTGRTKVEETENKSTTQFFRRTNKLRWRILRERFTCRCSLPKPKNNNFSIGSVTFEPGARSNWHRHPAGQTLLVIEGKGLYQEKGKPVRTLNEGDVILCNADIEHWHGASPESEMTHIAITNFKGDSNVTWLKPVMDEEYNTGVK